MFQRAFFEPPIAWYSRTTNGSLRLFFLKSRLKHFQLTTHLLRIRVQFHSLFLVFDCILKIIRRVITSAECVQVAGCILAQIQ